MSIYPDEAFDVLIAWCDQNAKELAPLMAAFTTAAWRDTFCREYEEVE